MMGNTHRFVQFFVMHTYIYHGQKTLYVIQTAFRSYFLGFDAFRENVESGHVFLSNLLIFVLSQVEIIPGWYTASR
jgi:hypothetical protein